jgi:hypothetical protein
MADEYERIAISPARFVQATRLTASEAEAQAVWLGPERMSNSARLRLTVSDATAVSR